MTDKKYASTTTAPSMNLSGIDAGDGKIDESSLVMSGQIDLNIGGVLYSTSSSTLLMEKESFFSGLLSGKFPLTKDKNGRVFIDRDGTHFRHILNWLREAGREFDVADLDLSASELKLLIKEAKFYQLKQLEQVLLRPRARAAISATVIVLTAYSSDYKNTTDTYVSPYISALETAISCGFTVIGSTSYQHRESATPTLRFTLSATAPTEDWKERLSAQQNSRSSCWYVTDATSSI